MWQIDHYYAQIAIIHVMVRISYKIDFEFRSHEARHAITRSIPGKPPIDLEKTFYTNCCAHTPNYDSGLQAMLHPSPPEESWPQVCNRRHRRATKRLGQYITPTHGRPRLVKEPIIPIFPLHSYSPVAGKQTLRQTFSKEIILKAGNSSHKRLKFQRSDFKGARCQVCESFLGVF